MTCKNCHTNPNESDKFCATCGAQIIQKRITFKNLMSDFFNRFFGWDNKYFVTVKTLILKPELVLHGYVDGLRKRYVNPLTFFAIGVTVTILVFNLFQDDFLRISTGGGINSETIEAQMPEPVMGIGPEEMAERQALAKAQMVLIMETQKSILKYFNLYSFLLLPLYAFIAFLVFGKRYNYAEHLVINAYIQGMLFLNTTLFFLLGIFLLPDLYMFSIIPSILFYSYSYGRLFKQSFGKVILYLLKFFGIALAGTIFMALIAVLIEVIVKIFTP